MLESHHGTNPTTASIFNQGPATWILLPIPHLDISATTIPHSSNQLQHSKQIYHSRVAIVRPGPKSKAVAL